MIAAGALAAALEPVLDAALALDPDARARVARLEGAVLEVRVLGPDVAVYAIPEDGRLRFASTAPDAAGPAAAIAAPPASLARLGTTGGTRVLFGGAVRVTGDVAVAKAYKRLLDTLDPDWEEALAGAVGDIAAHETGRAARAARDWLRRAAAGRRADLQAWLVDELEASPARAEADAWLADVDRLRADADRLAARVARLERRDGGAGR